MLSKEGFNNLMEDSFHFLTPTFITDMYYPQLKYYTNRMFVADYSELKNLGRPKIKIKKIK